MKRLLAGLLAAALLSGCASELSPDEKLRDLTAALVQAANDRDPSGLRVAAEDLQAEIDEQERTGQLTQNNATVLSRQIALLVRNADLLTATAEPTVSPTPSLSPTPSPTPTLSPTPSPTPSLSPTPSPTPVETQAPPTQTPDPTITLGGLGGSSPAPSATP